MVDSRSIIIRSARCLKSVDRGCSVESTKVGRRVVVVVVEEKGVPREMSCNREGSEVWRVDD